MNSSQSLIELQIYFYKTIENVNKIFEKTARSESRYDMCCYT